VNLRARFDAGPWSRAREDDRYWQRWRLGYREDVGGEGGYDRGFQTWSKLNVAGPQGAKSECATRCISPSTAVGAQPKVIRSWNPVTGLGPSGRGAIRAAVDASPRHDRLGHGSRRYTLLVSAVSSTRRSPGSLPLGAILPNKPNLQLGARPGNLARFAQRLKPSWRKHRAGDAPVKRAITTGEFFN